MGIEVEGSELVKRIISSRRLRELWCLRSRETGWDPPDDWWTPAVESLCAAAFEGTDMSAACVRFGQARARSGTSIGAALTDFAALTDVLGWSAPPLDLVTSVAEGWVDGGRSRDDCQDPLTGLATTAYLRTRLGEVYRGSGPEAHPSATHVLILVALASGIDPWRRTARLIVLGHELRQVFTQGESIALLSRGRIAVLAPLSPHLDERVRRLRDELCLGHEADVWTVALPDDLDHALTFLNEVGKPPMSA
ncbi:hypothetical protein CDO52_01050 [Nocardiopsis gilva YIM 90087]|uniref:Uncharacterized protein n=1 Tax=Nocardiopsis gilva YIM 90087 TaxID=1235441 RepID=A0A223S0B0_9ACTN|nr:hypothetical protein CDO52_01050 [Nocardiopsis gilva YIM 90087]